MVRMKGTPLPLPDLGRLLSFHSFFLSILEKESGNYSRGLGFRLVIV